jgi:FMN-dependent NADH-azoreductase
MKTLIISYLPSGEGSSTKILLDHLLSKINKQDIEILDLLKNPPPFFLSESMTAYYTRNYGGHPLDEKLGAAIKPFDELTNQFAAADIVIFAHPMHNFGIPGIVKTYYDSVMQKGVAFDYGPKGPFGKFTGKKGLVVYTSAGKYTADKASTEYPDWNTLSVLSKIEFSFMGMEAEVIGASIGNPAEKEANIEDAKKKIDTVIGKWF